MFQHMWCSHPESADACFLKQLRGFLSYLYSFVAKMYYFNWGIPSSDGIPNGVADFFFFFLLGFLHCVWPPEMPFSVAEGNRGEKKKKSRQPHWGTRQRTGCPN